MNQLDLFDHSTPARAFARHTDPETSQAAAIGIEPALPRLQTLVLETLRRHPAGLTTHEIATDLRLDLVTISPRG